MTPKNSVRERIMRDIAHFVNGQAFNGASGRFGGALPAGAISTWGNASTTRNALAAIAAPTQNTEPMAPWSAPAKPSLFRSCTAFSSETI